jgi:uncharacterized membrane protein YraQ (UPF0718 family)
VTIVLAVLRVAAATTWQLLPYVILGVLASEGLRYTNVAPLLERGCRKHPAVAIPAAALLGIASPICTFATVPLVVQLLRTGVPIAPLATFLSTSSLMNPQLLVITWGGLGAKMALVRVGAVFVFGLLLGALLQVLPVRLAAQPPKPDEKKPKACGPFTVATFAIRSWKTLQFVGTYVVLGAVLGALIEVLVPGQWVSAAFGSGGWYQTLLAALLGIPLYACGGGVIPLVHSMMGRGMAGGAALAFLIAGPATRVPPLMALAAVVRPLAVVAYVVFLVAYSVVAGLLYGLF